MWHLCDGERGTPDLRNYFVPAAGVTYNPGDTGGAPTHVHTATSDTHRHHTNPAPLAEATAPPFHYATDYRAETFTSDPTNHRPPYFALAYVMYLKCRR